MNILESVFLNKNLYRGNITIQCKQLSLETIGMVFRMIYSIISFGFMWGKIRYKRQFERDYFSEVLLPS